MFPQIPSEVMVNPVGSDGVSAVVDAEIVVDVEGDGVLKLVVGIDEIEDVVLVVEVVVVEEDVDAGEAEEVVDKELDDGNVIVVMVEIEEAAGALDTSSPSH
jgi:hypothetical protein